MYVIDQPATTDTQRKRVVVTKRDGVIEIDIQIPGRAPDRRSFFFQLDEQHATQLMAALDLSLSPTEEDTVH